MGIIYKENAGKTTLQGPEWQYENSYIFVEKSDTPYSPDLCHYGNPVHMSNIT